MGYDLHITRKKFWADEDGEKISYDEWMGYLADDPEIIPDPINTDGYFLFHHKEADCIFHYDYGLEEITVKNPPNDVIIKMVKISLALGARVQGDDQEFYDINGNIFKDEKNKALLSKSKDTNPYERYVKYLYIIAFLSPIIWHLFFSKK